MGGTLPLHDLLRSCRSFPTAGKVRSLSSRLSRLLKVIRTDSGTSDTGYLLLPVSNPQYTYLVSFPRRFRSKTQFSYLCLTPWMGVKTVEFCNARWAQKTRTKVLAEGEKVRWFVHSFIYVVPQRDLQTYWQLLRTDLQPLLSTLSAVEMLRDSALYKCKVDIDIDRNRRQYLATLCSIVIKTELQVAITRWRVYSFMQTWAYIPVWLTPSQLYPGWQKHSKKLPGVLTHSAPRIQSALVLIAHSSTSAVFYTSLHTHIRSTGIRRLMWGIVTLPKVTGAISGQRQSWKTPRWAW